MPDELIGMEQLQAALAASPLVALTAIGGALYREGQRIMVDSKRVVPVGIPPGDKHPGTLRASGTVFDPVVEGTTVEVVLGYGGAAQAYAVVQHENLHFQHRGNQKAKYLEDPVNAHAVGFDARLAADLAAVDLFPGVV